MQQDFSPVPLGSAWRAPMDIVQRQAVLASTLNSSGVLDRLPVIALVLNKERQIVFANQNLALALGRPAAGALGQRLGEALGCIHRHATESGCGTTPFCCYCGAARAIINSLNGRQDVQECRITREGSDGCDALSAANYQITTTPLPLAGERFLFATMIDISFERRVEMLEQLFFHDLLDTSSGIHGLCALLAEQLAGGLRKEADVLLGASSRLVDQLLAQRQMAAAESRELEVQPVKLGTRSILLELIDFFRLQAVTAGKNLVLDPDCADVFFCTDKNLLYRVLANLTRNALEASELGESVTLSCGREPEGVFFRVHNPGVMSESVRLQLFTRFFSTKGPGRGLGTYGARLFAEGYLGGQLTVRSQAGAGTVFSIHLPDTLSGSGVPPLSR